MKFLAKKITYLKKISKILFLFNKMALAVSFYGASILCAFRERKRKKTEQCWGVCCLSMLEPCGSGKTH